MSAKPELHLNSGPQCVTATMPDHRATRWCFACRKHLPHTWSMLWDGPERQPSYYDPTPVLRCSGCGDDQTVGFGADYDGPHYPESAVTWAVLCRLHKTTTEAWDWAAIWERERKLTGSWQKSPQGGVEAGYDRP